MEALYLVIGLVVGLIIAWFVLNRDKSKIENKNESLNQQQNELISTNKFLEDKINDIKYTLNNTETELKQKTEDIIELTRQLSKKDADFTNLENRLKENKVELEQLQEKFSTEFKNLANEILEEKTKKFTELNKTNLDEILKPLGDRIKDFEKKVDETYDKESQQRYSLKIEIKNMMEQTQMVSKEASNLTKALKGEAKTQGNWGEMILESILEKSGLVKNREYFVQPSFAKEDSEKGRLQPDIVVTLPGNRNIIIDSKVSLVAYDRYCSFEDKVEQDTALKEHVRSIKHHIDELSSKKYPDIQLETLDFVIMFIPVEPAYLLAVQYDTSLLNYAYQKRIVLNSPTNLIFGLKMASNIWRQEYQSRNASEIAKKSGELYDKFVGLIDDLIEIGKRLVDAKSYYDKSMKKLYSGRGNLVKRAEDIKELGAKTTKSIPQIPIDRVSEEEN